MMPERLILTFEYDPSSWSCLHLELLPCYLLSAICEVPTPELPQLHELLEIPLARLAG